MIKIAVNPNINHLEQARDKIIDVFSEELKGGIFDNGLVDMLVISIKQLELAIQNLKRRG